MRKRYSHFSFFAFVVFRWFVALRRCCCLLLSSRLLELMAPRRPVVLLVVALVALAAVALASELKMINPAQTCYRLNFEPDVPQMVRCFWLVG